MKYYEGSIGDKMARQKGGRISLSDVKRLHTYFENNIFSQ